MESQETLRTKHNGAVQHNRSVMHLKGSFVMYADQKAVFESMSDEDAGKLIKSIYEYATGNEPVLHGLMMAIFSQFKATLDRDFLKWLNTCNRNHKNGLRGGRPSKQIENPKEPTGLSGLLEKPKKPDSDSDSDSDSENKDANALNFTPSAKAKTDLQGVPVPPTPNVAPTPSPEPLPFQSQAFAEAWKSWEKHRREIRKTLTPSTRRMQLNKCAKWGEKKAIETIKRSIENGWMGLFESTDTYKKQENIDTRKKYGY